VKINKNLQKINSGTLFSGDLVVLYERLEKLDIEAIIDADPPS
jgi:hypothetical protein